jgi:peptidase E
MRFADLAGSLSHLPLGASSAEASAWAASLDLIYVGGGNTARLVSHFRETGIADVLAEATAKGTVLAGVSAGAACWFDKVLTDSLGNGLRPMDGLGIVPGSCCPHYSTEPLRQTAFPEAIARGTLPEGYAIDDGAAIRLISSGEAEVFSARMNAGARRLPK